MKERIELINHLAEVLYNETRGQYTIGITKAKVWQDIIDEMQEELDEITNELYRPER